MKIELFTVAPTGVGKRDYSQGIEFASQATSRGHQARDITTLDIILDTAAFPDFWAQPMEFFWPDGSLRYEAPSTPLHIHDVVITSERNALVLAGLYRFASFADMAAAWPWTVEVWYGDIWGYGKAELHYTNGIKTEPGKFYAIAFSEYSEEPTFHIHMTVGALKEEIIYG